MIGGDGETIGIVSRDVALEKANEEGLDLVMISGDAKPPVCKLLNYGRHRYEQDKRRKDAKKKQHTVKLKEITLSYKLGEHDYQVRQRRLQSFLEKGNKVKMVVRLRGREMQHSKLAIELLKRFADSVEEISVYEREPKLEGYRIIMILSPKKEKK